MAPSLPAHVLADKCDLPYLAPNGSLVFFDVQSAEPGTFTVPNVIDIEVYEPGSWIETSWIFFKGDPMAGPQPGHPFDMPFNNSAKFAIDMIREDDNSTVIHELLPPTNSKPFWDGGAPFGRSGNYSLYMPRLDRSCKYYSIAAMLYRWIAPDDIEEDVVFRLKLTTNVPPTTHLSGKLMLSQANATLPPSVLRDQLDRDGGFSEGRTGGLILAVIFSVLLIWWVVWRLRRRSRRVVLE